MKFAGRLVSVDEFCFINRYEKEVIKKKDNLLGREFTVCVSQLR